VGNPDDVRHVVDAAVTRFGGFDTWINDAGVAVYGKLLQIPMEDHHRVFQTNLWGLVHGSLMAARHLRDRGGMALVLAHPDYAVEPRVAGAWSGLLEEFRDDDTVWQALPREVADWWRRRASSTIRETGVGWDIQGPAAADGTVRFALPGTPAPASGVAS